MAQESIRTKVTITEIARQAGVSVPTVSRVVNGRSDVSPETRARIEDLLQLRGYQRKPAAPRARAALIDLVFNDLDSPWAVEIIRGVEDVAHASGVGMVVSAIHGASGPALQWMTNLRVRASDGVILVTSVLEPRLHEELRRLGVPLVVIDPAGSMDLDVPTVGAANWAGGVAATEHLLARGHRRIGFCRWPAAAFVLASPTRWLPGRTGGRGHRARRQAGSAGRLLPPVGVRRV